MAENPADGGSSNGTDEIVNSRAACEIPGLFSEYEGVISSMASPFEASNQSVPVQAVPIEVMKSSSSAEFTSSHPGTSCMASPFEVSNQLVPVQAVPIELVESSSSAEFTSSHPGTSCMASPFEISNQSVPVQAVPTELVESSSSAEFTFSPPGAENVERESLDVYDYIQLIEQSEFADPELRREEIETEVREIEDDVSGEQDPVTSPDELFSNVTDDYEEMFSSATADLFSGEEREGDENDRDELKPLYPNAPLTVAESLLLIITFAIRHTLSGSALNDLLILISLHCISPNLCRKSLHQFQHFFCSIKNPLVYHRYCSYCFLLVDDRHTVTCPNPLCSRDLTQRNSCSFFIEIPIASQIRNLFAKSGFYEKLSHRFKRAKRNDNHFEDIYDGSEYKKHCNPGILDCQHNVSLLWNTDGVPVFKSSKFSIWPLYFIINELPFTDRTKRENMLFAGLWFGETKPFMLTFLQPFHSSLRKAETDGVKVTLKEGNNSTELLSKVILLAGTCDLPAKCLVCNSVQYNGRYGCLKCKQKGESVKVSARGHVHAFPFIRPNPYGPQRTHFQTL